MLTSSGCNVSFGNFIIYNLQSLCPSEIMCCSIMILKKTYDYPLRLHLLKFSKVCTSNMALKTIGPPHNTRHIHITTQKLSSQSNDGILMFLEYHCQSNCQSVLASGK